MLHFQGIRRYSGKPEKFSYSFEASTFLRLALDALKYARFDFLLASNHLISKIEQIYSPENRDSPLEKKKNSKLLHLAKATVQYLGLNDDMAISGNFLENLLGEGKIEQKWQKVRKILLETLVPNLGQDYSSADSINKSEKFLDGLLNLTALYFMELVEERPPSNIELVIDTDNFPDFSWQSTDTVSFRKSAAWVPDHPLCSVSRLLSNLLSDKSQSNMALTQDGFQNEVNYLPDNPLGFIYPQGFKLDSVTGVSLDISSVYGKEDKPESLPLDDSPAESFKNLQYFIFKLYKDEGFLHVANVLRHLNSDPDCLYTDFVISDFFEDIYGESTGKISVKRRNLLENALGVLSGTMVRRSMDVNGVIRSVETPLITRVSVEYKYKADRSSNEAVSYRYLKDPFLCRTHKSSIPIGYPIVFLPKEFFQQSAGTIQKSGKSNYPYINEIAIYLAGCWYNEFDQSRGVLEQPMLDIINKSAIIYRKEDQYKRLNNLKRTMTYLQQIGVISELDFGHEAGSGRKNMGENICRIKAGNYTMSMLARNNNL